MLSPGLGAGSDTLSMTQPWDWGDCRHGSCTYNIPKVLLTTVRDQRGCFATKRLSDRLPKTSPWQHLPPEWSAHGECKHVVPLSSPCASQHTSPHVPDEVPKSVMPCELPGAVTVSYCSVTGPSACACGEQSNSLGSCWICWKTHLSLSLSPHFSFRGNRTPAVPWQKLLSSSHAKLPDHWVLCYRLYPHLLSLSSP